MYRYTLADARNSGALKRIAGVCSSSQQFTDLVNEATRRLLRRGDWFDTDFNLRLCVSGCIIAWPRFVGAIRGVRFAGCYNTGASVFNNFYSFVNPLVAWGNLYHNNYGTNSGVLEDTNLAPVFNDISGTTGKLLRYYVVNYEDIGKTITINGTQYGGQPLQTQDSAGHFTNGINITAAAPYGTNAALVTRIDAITRQATTGLGYLYEYDPATGYLRDLAVYQPGETNPRFRRSKILNKPVSFTQPDANGICWTNIDALVKVEFVEVQNPGDYLMLDNFDAIKFMIQAINAEDASDTQTSEARITQAIRELNFELRNKNPDQQTPVFVNAIMGGQLANPI